MNFNSDLAIELVTSHVCRSWYRLC